MTKYGVFSGPHFPFSEKKSSVFGHFIEKNWISSSPFIPVDNPEAYSEHRQTSKMKLFAEIFNGI